jgi:type VI secretion system protein ImpF
MAKIQSDQPLLPSVLDRLLDDDPQVQREPAKSRHQVLADLKHTVRRDLEDLLNTRRRCLPWPAEWKDLERSLVNYGMPDFTGANRVVVDQREDLRRLIEVIVRTWEPRFQSVRVHLLDNVEPLDRTLRFRIDALLRADPAPEPIVFDTALEPGSVAFEVKGVSR